MHSNIEASRFYVIISLFSSLRLQNYPSLFQRVLNTFYYIVMNCIVADVTSWHPIGT